MKTLMLLLLICSLSSCAFVHKASSEREGSSRKVASLYLPEDLLKKLEIPDSDDYDSLEFIVGDLNLQDEESVGYLLGLVEKGNYMAASAMGNMKKLSSKAILGLIHLMDHSNDEVRAYATMALGYGDSSARISSYNKYKNHMINYALAKKLEDKSDRVRTRAHEALSYRKPKDKATTYYIKSLLMHKNQNIQESAKSALLGILSKERIDSRYHGA